VRRLVLVGGLLATLALSAAPAHAGTGGGSVFFGVSFPTFGGGGIRTLSDTQLRVTVSGGVAVAYHGSTKAGCEQLGLCDVSGAVTWNPGSSGVVDLARYIQHGKHRLAGYFVPGTYGPFGQTTMAQVTRRLPDGSSAVCGDARGGYSGLSSLTSLASHSLAALSMRLVDPDALDFMGSHCAGPLASDLVKLLPVRPLPRSLLDGRSTKTIDLSTTRPFDTGGFSGTLRSTVVLRVGPKLSFDGAIDEEVTVVKRRYRELELGYRIESVSGNVSLGFRGVPAPEVCGGLDSCGTSNTLELSPAASKGEFELSATARDSRPWRDLRQSLGLAPGGPSHGVETYGYGYWKSRAGTLSSKVSYSDGGAQCRDVVPLRYGSLVAGVSSSRVVFSYYPGVGLTSGPSRTRCPGPMLSDLPNGSNLAAGSVPLSALGRRTITVHLTHGLGSLSVPGYSGSSQQDLTITLRRTSVRKRTYKLEL
jgi:hypothetical protein